jgi:hypothetical protein
MSPRATGWTFNPHAGGSPIPPAMQDEVRRRILAHAEKKGYSKHARIDVRFRGQFCYIDAYEDDLDPPLHLCRLRYFAGWKEEWTWAFFTYSNEQYSPAASHDGGWTVTPEEALDWSSGYLST